MISNPNFSTNFNHFHFDSFQLCEHFLLWSFVGVGYCKSVVLYQALGNLLLITFKENVCFCNPFACFISCKPLHKTYLYQQHTNICNWIIDHFSRNAQRVKMSYPGLHLSFFLKNGFESFSAWLFSSCVSFSCHLPGGSAGCAVCRGKMRMLRILMKYAIVSSPSN